MRRWFVLGAASLAVAVAVPTARAVPLGGTAIVDRPSGNGALPFDGIAESVTSRQGMTPDGRFVVFTSSSNALLSGDEDTAENVYRVDLTTGNVVQVDTTASGGQPTAGSINAEPSISADGNHVGFLTTSPALAAGADDRNPQFVVKNVSTGTLELASRSDGATGAPVASLALAVLSGDGRHVAFSAQSAVQTLSGATGVTTTVDAYVRSLDANTTRMVSVPEGAGSTEGGGVNSEPAIDFAGDAVAFVTSSGLVAGDTDASVDAYVRTGIGGTEHTLLVSFTTGQTSGAAAASDVALANSAAGLQFAWTNNSRIFWAPCSLTACTTPAVQADHARTGGNDDLDNGRPVFPPEPNATTFPTRIYWNTRDPLDPADTNGSDDLYGWDIGNNNFDAAIHLMTGGDAPQGVFDATATNDGAVTVFDSRGPNLPGANGAVDQVFVRRAGTDVNVSQPLGQPPRTNAAGAAFIARLHVTSDDGRFVAFTSNAPAFGTPVLSNEGPAEQVLVRDVASATTQLVSAVSGAQTPGNKDSSGASIDAAGDRVVFLSNATNLVPGDTNGQADVFLRNLTTGVTTLVDRTAGGGSPVHGAGAAQISADGTKAAFISDSPDIPGAPPDSLRHVYEVDLASGDVTLIDQTTAGAAANGSAHAVDLDGDGRRIAFVSQASNLGGSTSASVYVRDLTNPAAPTTTWISAPQDGSPTHDDAHNPSISRTGGRVAFDERDATFGFGMAGTEQVFVRDLGGGPPTLASAGPAGPAATFGNGPSISADGSRLSFMSNAPNLPGATPGFGQVYVRDLAHGTTSLASARNGSSSGGRFGADAGSLSGNGACLVFSSQSDDLVAGGYGSDFEHVYLRALSAACPAGSNPPPTDTTPPLISRFSLTHKRFAVGRTATALSTAKPKKPRPPSGTTFTFTLSERATARIAITQKLKGHRSNRRAPCRPARRGQKRNCTFTLSPLTLTRAALAAGANRVAFSGRYAHKRLATGTYTATITATDAAGNRSKPSSLTFTVVG